MHFVCLTKFAEDITGVPKHNAKLQCKPAIKYKSNIKNKSRFNIHQFIQLQTSRTENQCSCYFILRYVIVYHIIIVLLPRICQTSGTLL